LEGERGGRGTLHFLNVGVFFFNDGPIKKTKIIIKCGVFVLCKWHTPELLDGLNY
jgi:hypothetical protein